MRPLDFKIISSGIQVEDICNYFAHDVAFPLNRTYDY
jgi:hypothetical protein